MRDDVTVREVMRREFVGVSESDPLREAVELLLSERAGPAVVLRGGEAVGTLREADALERVVAAEALEGPVSEAMSRPLPAVSPDTGVAAATEELADAGTGSLLVRDGEEVAGLLTAADLVAASVALANQPGTEEAADARVRWEAASEVASVTGAEPAGEAGPEAAHGVCETCGSLSADLREVEGQRRCPDCREA